LAIFGVFSCDFRGKVSGGVSLRILVWASHMTTWSSFLSDLAPPNS
jgi:hypothetical protein